MTRRSAPPRTERASTPTSRSRRSSTCASGATSGASTSSPRRRRSSTSRPASPRRSTAASCRSAPASASATTSRCRCPTTRAPTTSPSAPSGRTRRTCCASPTADRGSTTCADRSSGTARCASTTPPARPARGRMSLWPSNSAQTISFGGYTKLAHKTQVTGFFSYGLWSNDEPLQPFTINSALPTIALPRANADAEAHVFSTNLNLTSHPTTDWRFGARFRNYTYANQMPATSITQYVNYDSSVVDDPDRRSRSLRPRPDHVRRRRDVERDEAARADRRLHAQRQRLRRADLPVERRGRVPRVGRRGGILLDHLPRRNTRSAAAPDRAWTRQALTDIGEHPEMRHYDLADRTRNRFTGQIDIVPSDAWMFSVSGGHPARRLQQHRLRAAGVDRAHVLARPPTTTCRTAWARAPPTTSSAIPDCSNRTRGIRQTRSSTIRCATGRPTRPRRSTTSPFTRRRPASAATPRCGSRTISATRQAITSTPFRRAARFRRPISCRRCSTSCSSCTSTRATG